MNFDCRIEGNDTYEGRGSSYEEAADEC